jgi:hypothetical protein
MIILLKASPKTSPLTFPGSRKLRNRAQYRFHLQGKSSGCEAGRA